jgi:hypothetical protein
MTTTKATALNRWEQARKEQQYALLSRSVEAQEDRIAEHYSAFAHLAMQLRALAEERKRRRSPELDDAIRHLCKVIREGHLMEFGIELEWPAVEAAGKEIAR